MNYKSYLNISELEPLCLLRRIVTKLWAVILAALIGVMAVEIYLCADISRSYSCSTTFVVAPKSGSSTASSFNTAITAAGKYASLLQSDVMRLAVWDAIGMEPPVTISATQQGNTNLIRVTVTADTPKDALITMQALADNYDVVGEYIVSNVVLTEFSTPNVSVTPTNTYDRGKMYRNGAILGGGAVTLLVMYFAITAGTIHNKAGAKNLLDADVVASIPHSKQMSYWFPTKKQKRKRSNITFPTVDFSFAEAIHRLASRVEHEKTSGKTVFQFTSVTEGEGKSTVAANVAMSLAMKNSRVLLIDLDLRKPVQAGILGLKVPKSDELGEQLLKSITAKQVLLAAKEEPISHLHALVSHGSYPNAVDLLSGDLLPSVIATARELYDYVIIDLPPIGYFTEGELVSDMADASLLVVRQDLVSADIINDVADTLRAGRAEFLGCVLNNMVHLSSGSTGYGYGYGYGKYGYGKYGYGQHGYGKSSSGKAQRK